MTWRRRYWGEVPHYFVTPRQSSNHTVMLFDKKYMDVESGKYITDKIPTLYSLSLSDLVHNSNYYVRDRVPAYYGDYEDVETDDQVVRIRKLPKFVPKDDDFEVEEVKQHPVVRQSTPEELQAAREAKEREEQWRKEAEEIRQREYYERERQRNIAFEAALNASKIQQHQDQQREMAAYYARVNSEREIARKAEEKRIKEQQEKEILEFHRKYAEAALRVQQNSKRFKTTGISYVSVKTIKYKGD